MDRYKLKQIIEECVHQILLEMSPRLSKTVDAFITQANEKHRNKYDYSKVVYKGTDTPVIITCPCHGDFQQTPHHHLEGQGCPRCEDSHLERETARALITEGVEFVRQKPLVRQRLDFYLPVFNAAIECQGRQHYEPIWGNERLEQQ